jgi:hypothetical protein
MYQELYARYQTAIKLRELNVDNNFKLLKELFTQKIMKNLSLNAPSEILPYCAGIKEVFSFVDSETSNISNYREKLDELFKEENKGEK